MPNKSELERMHVIEQLPFLARFTSFAFSARRAQLRLVDAQALEIAHILRQRVPQPRLASFGHATRAALLAVRPSALATRRPCGSAVDAGRKHASLEHFGSVLLHPLTNNARFPSVSTSQVPQNRFLQTRRRLAAPSADAQFSKRGDLERQFYASVGRWFGVPSHKHAGFELSRMQPHERRTALFQTDALVRVARHCVHQSAPPDGVAKISQDPRRHWLRIKHVQNTAQQTHQSHPQFFQKKIIKKT